MYQEKPVQYLVCLGLLKCFVYLDAGGVLGLPQHGEETWRVIADRTASRGGKESAKGGRESGNGQGNLQPWLSDNQAIFTTLSY